MTTAMGAELDLDATDLDADALVAAMERIAGELERILVALRLVGAAAAGALLVSLAAFLVAI